MTFQLSLYFVVNFTKFILFIMTDLLVISLPPSWFVCLFVCMCVVNTNYSKFCANDMRKYHIKTNVQYLMWYQKSIKNHTLWTVKNSEAMLGTMAHIKIQNTKHKH